MSRIRRWTAVSFVAIGVVAFATSWARAVGGDDPRELVRGLTDKVIAVLRDEGFSNDQKRAEIEKIVYDYVDFEAMSRLVLARNWRGLSEAKQREFVEEFKKHLSVTYGSSVENYHNETVTITADREEARGDWTVKTQIVRNGPNDIFVEYRLRKSESGWKIIDVIIERVSLVSNFRSQFQEIMANGGIDRLLKLLREKNAEGSSGLKS